MRQSITTIMTVNVERWDDDTRGCNSVTKWVTVESVIVEIVGQKFLSKITVLSPYHSGYLLY